MTKDTSSQCFKRQGCKTGCFTNLGVWCNRGARHKPHIHIFINNQIFGSHCLSHRIIDFIRLDCFTRISLIFFISKERSVCDKRWITAVFCPYIKVVKVASEIEIPVEVDAGST